MTDNQFYILITVVGTGLAAIGTAIRFAATRIVRALDKNSDAMIKNTESNAVLSTKIDSIANYVRDRDTTPVEGVPVRPQGGYKQHFPRKKSEPGSEGG